MNPFVQLWEKIFPQTFTINVYLKGGAVIVFDKVLECNTSQCPNEGYTKFFIKQLKSARQRHLGLPDLSQIAAVTMGK